MIGSKLLRLAFYDAPDGPRIMLFGPKEVDIGALRGCFRRLSLGEGPLQLHLQPFVFAAGNIQIGMYSTGGLFKNKTPVSQQGIRRTQDESCSYTWTRTNEGWDYLAELIDSLTKLGSTGHQYLTRYPDEDAIVVVSKGEYADDVINS